MSVRRNTDNRRFLIRTCQTCGKSFRTTAASPWIRQMVNVDGKKQKTCYFCSSSCFKASYKHIGCYDGKYRERKAKRDAERDTTEKNRRYYEAHTEAEKARQKARYWATHEESLAAQAYSKKKRKLLRNTEV